MLSFAIIPSCIYFLLPMQRCKKMNNIAKKCHLIWSYLCTKMQLYNVQMYKKQRKKKEILCKYMRKKFFKNLLNYKLTPFLNIHFYITKYGLYTRNIQAYCVIEVNLYQNMFVMKYSINLTTSILKITSQIHITDTFLKYHKEVLVLLDYLWHIRIKIVCDISNTCVFNPSNFFTKCTQEVLHNCHMQCNDQT